MVSIRIDGARTVGGKLVDIAIEDGLISSISPAPTERPEAEWVVNAKGDIVMPGLCNSHTHAAMNILRGVGEDMELQPWLEKRIWPMEAKLGLEHLVAGMELACLEMIRTGTTLFNDMYFREGDMVSAVSRSGMRAFLGEGFIDLFNEERMEASKRSTLDTLRMIEEIGDPMVGSALAPHAVYSVSEEGLNWCRDEANKRRAPLHIHLCETKKEVSDIREKKGCTPVEYLDGLDLLRPGTIAAHSVHLSDRDVELISKRGCTVSHLPVSNMKLSVGGNFRMGDLMGENVRVTLGTDGAASNNSLDMFQTMKFASLLAKQNYGASSIRASDVLEMATKQGYEGFGIDGGELREGAVADLIVLERKHPSLVPGYDMVSNIVYSASGDCVKHSIIGGEIVMMDRVVQREEEIIINAETAAQDLMEGK
ncbi:MAG: amidohydrolase [Candidatus Thermoplasmatota archaeon]|nr:amidohydrolase [Candidatus Thermoplasmatota archaeon]